MIGRAQIERRGQTIGRDRMISAHHARVLADEQRATRRSASA